MASDKVRRAIEVLSVAGVDNPQVRQHLAQALANAGLLVTDRLQDALARAAVVEAEVKQLRAYRLVMAVFGVPEDAPQPFALLDDDNKPFALGVQWPGGAVTVKSTPPERLGNVTSASLDDYFTQYGAAPVVWLSEDLGTLAEHEERAMAAEQAVARVRAEVIEQIAQTLDEAANAHERLIADIAAVSTPRRTGTSTGLRRAADIVRQQAEAQP